VISILIVFVLSVLGMALMLTTTTETDISANYRWGEMAFFNAEAGLEYGKNVLAAYALQDTDFRNVLPNPRGPLQTCQMTDSPATCDPGACSDPRAAGCRDYQYQLDLDEGNPVGSHRILYIGRVLRDFNTANRRIQYDFRQPMAGDARGDIDGDGTMDIEGAITIWVRRPVEGDHDYEGNDRAVLTAEGTAPNFSYIPGGGRAGSVRRLEMTVSIAPASGVSGSDYSDVTRASDPRGTGPGTEGWNLVGRVR
jgi:hypothetical protein